MNTNVNSGWKKVAAPKRWAPEIGEILEGTYLGSRPADGKFGPYVKYLIADEDQNVWYLSGAVCDTLFISSLAQHGAKLRVVFLGMKETQAGEYKDFDMYVKDPLT